MGAAIGATLGGWGCADLGGGNMAQAIVASVVPLTLLGAPLRPAAPARPPRRVGEVEQRSRSWIFLTPAIFFIGRRPARPADPHDLPVVPQPQRPRPTSGWDNYRRVFDDKNFWNTSTTGDGTSSPAKLFWIGGGLDRAGHDRRRGRRPPHAAAPSTRGRRLRSADGRLLPVVVRGPLHAPRHDVQQHLVGHRRRRRSPRRSASPSPCSPTGSRGENAAKSLIFLPMAISFIGAGIIWRFMYQAREPSQAADRRAQRAVGLARRGQQLDDVEDHGRRRPAARSCSRC